MISGAILEKCHDYSNKQPFKSSIVQGSR